MPMMRRGPLARYPVEWVLRQASAHQVSGSIEVNAAKPITVYLRAGHVYQAVHGIPSGSAQPPAGSHDDEPSARRQVVGLITSVLAAEDGWYYHDPLGRHDDRGPWHWDVNGLLLDARVQSREDQSLGSWSTGDVALTRPVHERPVTVSADAWAVVVALAATAPAPELRSRLGWTSDRVVAALADLQASGALPAEEGCEPVVAEPAPVTVDGRPPALADLPRARDRHRPAAADQSSLALAFAPAPSAVAVADRIEEAVATGARHPGPLPPPPERTSEPGEDGDDRRSALRRLIASLRPS